MDTVRTIGYTRRRESLVALMKILECITMNKILKFRNTGEIMRLFHGVYNDGYAVILCLCAFMSLCLNVLNAGELPKLLMLPTLSVETKSNNNIYNDAVNERSANITMISPGALLRVPAKPQTNVLSLEYHADILSYSVASSTNDTVNHLGALNLKMGRPDKISFSLSDRYNDTSDSPSTELTGRIFRKENTGNASLNIPFTERFSLGLAYSNVIHSYEATDFKATLDRKESEIGTNFNFKVTPKSALLINYARGAINFDSATNTRDSVQNILRAGIETGWTKKNSIAFKTGMLWRQYEQPKENTSSTVHELSLKSQITPKVNTTFGFEKNITESSYSSNRFYKTAAARFSLGYGLTSRINIDLGQRLERNSYDVATTENNVTDNRSDVYWSSQLGFDWRVLSWLNARTFYEHQERNSKFSKFNYTNNIAGLQIRIRP